MSESTTEADYQQTIKESNGFNTMSDVCGVKVCRNDESKLISKISNIFN